MHAAGPHPPGPGRLEAIRLLRRHQWNYMASDVEIWRRYGDVARTTFPTTQYLFFHPDAARRFLKDNARNYTKSAEYEELRPLLGDGLLTSEGELWRAQRKIAAPEFFPQTVASYGPLVADLTRQQIDAMARAVGRDEAIVDVSAEMMELTFAVACRAFFGLRLGAQSTRVRENLEAALDASVERIMSPLKLPLRWPTPRNRRLLKAVAELDDVIYAVLRANLTTPSAERRNIVSRLQDAADAETGYRMEARLIRDEAMTLMLAGHETSSNAMSWTLYLLGRHPEVQAQLVEEVDAVLGTRAPTAADVPSLPYCSQVLHEAMRLYPPLPAVSRSPIDADEIAGYRVEPGVIVACISHVIHRRPDMWPDPDVFRPERFAPANAGNIYPYAYLPFAAGPRACIGKSFALLEMHVILAMLVQRFRFTWIPERPAIPHPILTLRPKGGVWLKVRSR